MYPSSQVLRGVCQEPFPTSIITMLLSSKNIHTIYFNNSTVPLNTVIIITFIKVIRSYLVYIIIQPVRIEVVGVASP